SSNGDLLSGVTLLSADDDLCPRPKVLGYDFGLDLGLLALLVKEAVGHDGTPTLARRPRPIRPHDWPRDPITSRRQSADMVSGPRFTTCPWSCTHRLLYVCSVAAASRTACFSA